MYIADYKNQRIAKYTVSTNTVTTFAGTGSASYSGDNGAATSAALKYPSRAVVDTSGTIIHFHYAFYQ